MARALRILALAAAITAPVACAGRSEVDGVRAQARVVHQVAAGARVPGSVPHARILEWLVGELTRLGGRVERQAFTDSSLGRPLALTNVIARFEPAGGPGGAPAAGSGRAGGPGIVLCAHWDSRAGADQDPDPAFRMLPVPGANDGASGVAVLLEVAELMSRRPPPLPVDLVFLDGEDQGSRNKIGEAISAAQKSNAIVYVILIADRGFYGGFGYFGFSAMKKMTEETGGRLIDVGNNGKKLEAAFQQIEDELRTQYVASYTPSNAKLDGGFRHLTVECRGDGLKVQVRKGYFAPKPQD